MVGIASTPEGPDYWLAAGVFCFGDEWYCTSMGGLHRNVPVDGIAPSPDGAGCQLAAADGGVLAHGGAISYGSMGANSGTPQWSLWPPALQQEDRLSLAA